MPDDNRVHVSALAPAALTLVGEGATSAELMRRFARAGAATSSERCSGLLHELGDLGLVRVAGTRRGAAHYVQTSLGRQFAGALLGGDGDVAGRLQELEALRTDLLSTIAHELRTPLTAMRTCLGLLLDPATQPSPEEHQRLLETAARNADRVQRLIGDLLDLARFRAGRVRLQLRRFDARMLATGVAGAIEPLAERRGQRIEVVAPDEPSWVFGDHRRLEQALTNLVSNAQKFSPDGGRIEVTVERSDGEVRWTVTDEGPGIPDEDRPRLFERFFVGRSDRGPQPGAGLGLPTALAVAQAHGGRVDVASEPGRGSRFTIAVPADGPPEVGEG